MPGRDVSVVRRELMFNMASFSATSNSSADLQRNRPQLNVDCNNVFHTRWRLLGQFCLKGSTLIAVMSISLDETRMKKRGQYETYSPVAPQTAGRTTEDTTAVTVIVSSR